MNTTLLTLALIHLHALVAKTGQPGIGLPTTRDKINLTRGDLGLILWFSVESNGFGDLGMFL